MLKQFNEDVYGIGRYTFPIKLHALLCQATVLRVDGVISWDITGRKFIIYDEAKFVSNILPNIFKQSKFTSFRRQLNAYGFQRESKNLNPSMIFSHIYFRRDEPRSCRKISRQSRRPPTILSDDQAFESMIAETNFCRNNREVSSQQAFVRAARNPIPTHTAGDAVLDGLVEEIFEGETGKCKYNNHSGADIDMIQWDTTKEETFSSFSTRTRGNF